jgi:hypothetical protein
MHNQYSKIISRVLCIVSVLLSIMCYSPHFIQPASSAPGATITYTVDRTDDVIVYSGCDDGLADADCSLRGAIGLIPSYTSDNYVINIPDGVYVLNISTNPASEDVNAEGDLDIPMAEITLQGESMEGTIIDGNNTDRVLDVSGIVTLNDLTIRNGRLLTGEGGGAGIRLKSLSLVTNRVAITGNTVEGTADGDRGGGIYESGASSMTINDSNISNNHACWGGGIDHRNNSTFILSNSTLASNTAVHNGGGLIAWDGTNTIERSIFDGNSGEVGGGISIGSVTPFVITDSYFIGNISSTYGGGIEARGNVNLTNVTFYNNSGAFGGGGLNVGGYYDESRTANLVNVTFSSNHSHTPGGGSGGALSVIYRGVANLNHVTMADNTANSGNAIYVNYGSITAVSSIFTDSTDGSVCTFNNGGSLTSSNYNLSSDASCNLGAGDLVNQNLHFGAFGYFGGLTPTQRILTGSPAINFGNPADALNRLDQRGIPIIGGRSDSGAFEFIPPIRWLPLVFRP